MNLTMPWNASKPAKNGWSAPIEDVKQQIGQQVDHLVQVAAQVGRDVAGQAAQVSQEAGSQAAGSARDAGLQAAGTARDLGAQALKTTQDAGLQAAAVARDVPSAASSLAQQVINRAAQLGREIRAIRVTRQPAPDPRGPDVMPGIALLAGVGSGLALMYFFDPNDGRRRRALLRDQFTKWTRIGRETATGKAKDVRNRTVGVMYEARKVVTRKSEAEEEMDAIAAAARARSQGNGSNGNGQQQGGEQGQQTEQQTPERMPSEVG